MKDISGYIESLLDEFTVPYKITSPKKGVYRIDITKDLKKSWVFYSNSYSRDDNNVKLIRILLKKYLPQFEFLVKINYFNYPKDFGQPLLHEYNIKPRVHSYKK